MTYQADVSLAPMTTLGIGGPARHFISANSVADLQVILADASAKRWPVFVLGGGSNVVIADRGFAGLVVSVACADWQVLHADSESTRVRVGAGVLWDRVVDWAVQRDLAGIECLSGIPGRVGAAPIQNIGAYGQELAEAVAFVEVVDRQTGQRLTVNKRECGFGYRTSYFKTRWQNRYVIVALALDLKPHGAPTLRYGELMKAFSGSLRPGLQAVRAQVLSIRKSKSMVLDLADANSRSVGSFFVNPVVRLEQAAAIEALALHMNIGAMPRYAVQNSEAGSDVMGSDGIKLSAAWLIQHAGMQPGFGSGRVGLSAKHTLAIVNRGGATAEEVIEFAGLVQQRVSDVFGLQLLPEPQFIGFAAPVF